MVEDVTSADRIGPPKGEGGKGEGGKSDHDPLDDIDFDKVGQDRLQRAFAIATGSGGIGDGFEVDPAGVKAAMKHLDDAYKALENCGSEMRAVSFGLDVSPPGEEDASKRYVRQAQRVGDEVGDTIEVMKKNVKQTYDAMKRALKETERAEHQSADDLNRIDQGTR